MHVFLNWLVQGTAVTIIVALGVRARGTMTAATRERIWWVTVIGLTLMPAALPARRSRRRLSCLASRPRRTSPIR